MVLEQIFRIHGFVALLTLATAAHGQTPSRVLIVDLRPGGELASVSRLEATLRSESRLTLAGGDAAQALVRRSSETWSTGVQPTPSTVGRNS